MKRKQDTSASTEDDASKKLKTEEPKKEEAEEQPEQKETKEDTNQEEKAEPVELRDLTDEEKKILPRVQKQLDFYFSDSNFPRDKFLRGQSESNVEGYVSLDTILSFKRMQNMGGTLPIIQHAAENSETVKLNPKKTMVKRIYPLPEDDVVTPRSIFVSNYPVEGTTIDTVTEYFSKHGTVKSVRLLKKKTSPTERIFAGHIYVEFASTEEVTKVLEQKFEIGDVTLETTTKQARLDEIRQQSKRKREEEKPQRPIPKGLIIAIAGIKEGTDLWAIKDAFVKFGPVMFVEHKNGAETGFVRMETADDAQEAIKQVTETKLKIGESEITATLVTGAEEEEYWAKIRSTGSRKGGRRGGRGNRGKRRRQSRD